MLQTVERPLWECRDDDVDNGRRFSLKQQHHTRPQTQHHRLCAQSSPPSPHAPASPCLSPCCESGISPRPWPDGGSPPSTRRVSRSCSLLLLRHAAAGDDDGGTPCTMCRSAERRHHPVQRARAPHPQTGVFGGSRAVCDCVICDLGWGKERVGSEVFVM